MNGGSDLKERKVSVIIPLYNGEKYIERCIESLINQSYKYLEILVIDDNSNDLSAEIIEKYILNHSNIRYIKNNQTLGPAAARNKGLKYAEGEYILFLDCDDWIDLNCIEKAVCKFSSDPDIDIVLWEIKTAFQHGKICSRYEYLYNNVLTNKMALNLLSHTLENEFFLSPLLGCKLIKKALIDSNSIIFPDTMYEDDMFTYLAFLYAKKIALITGSCLYYYQHSKSLTHHFTEKNIIDFFATFSELYVYINENQKENYYKYLNKSLNSMIKNMLSNTSDPDIQAGYKTLIFSSFYQSIKLEEYYLYSRDLTI